MISEVTRIALRLGLQAEPYGVQFRLLSPTGVPLYVLTARGCAGGGTSWHVSSVLDLAVVVERESRELRRGAA